MSQRVVISSNIAETLTEAVGRVEFDRLFVLTDNTTIELCWPVIDNQPCVADAKHICIGSTDIFKNLDTLASVWTALQEGGATRHSLLICLGGGMVTDLGGFAASTFKRGIHYINIPTTLLSMVDASVGGKTGINFGGLKNEIGVFNEADTVILDTVFLKTLDDANLLSGYAEMLKHGLISNDEHFHTIINTEPEAVTSSLIAENVAVKKRIVTEDPYEKGLRKALNFGHTIGHAFESFAMHEERPILHGHAVALGMVCELYLSCIRCGFPTTTMRQVVEFIRQHYPVLAYTCDDYPTLFQLMQHDKKNTGSTINFTLLSGIGQLQLNQTATQEEIYETLDFLREGM